MWGWMKTLHTEQLHTDGLIFRQYSPGLYILNPISGIMKSPKLKAQEEDLSDALCEFDAVMEDFRSPVEKRHFRYDEHLKTVKRRSSASVSDSGISDSESAESLNRNSFSFSDERLNSPTTSSPCLISPKPKLGDTKELEDFIADLDKTLETM